MVPNSVLGLRRVDPNGLQLGVLVVGPNGLVATAEARLLVTTERRRGIILAKAVQCYHAGTDFTGQAQRVAQAAGIDRSGQTVDAVVGDFDRFVHGLEAGHAQYRPEGLLQELFALATHAVDDSRLHEHALLGLAT